MAKKYETRTALGAVAVAACVVELSGVVPTEIQLVPAGEFRARDGRPEDVAFWRCDAEAAARIIAKAEAAVGDFVIDYEHQTLLSEKNGQPAPAVGWFKKLEWREGDGLYAVDVRWTVKARAWIEANEYRYISPVLEYDKKTGVVLAVLMAAVTNYPALDGHSDLAVRAAAKFQSTTQEEDDVDRTQLIAMLGLADDASDKQITEALTALKAKAATADQKDTEIAGLKAAAGSPDPAKFVPLATFESLKAEVAALKSTQTTTEVGALVKKGLDDGKLLPVQEAWAKELGDKDLAALKSYLEKTPAIAALKGSQSGGKGEDVGGGDGVSAAELAVCKNLGITAEEYTKANKAD
ncbi:MAG: phage protease [Desulfobulbia bacterium]